MPLHLLGKKSWNVYNPENIAKVRRDEAAAKAEEEKQERRWREQDANSRLQILRGEEPTAAVTETESRRGTSPPHRRDRRPRKLAGEDDTDRDIRLAEANLKATTDLALNSRSREDVISGRSSGAERERPDERELPGMRFKDAAGIKQGKDKPWYAGSVSSGSGRPEIVGRDVWGNEDPGRRTREQQRLSAGDPLMAIKKGVKQLRETERERKAWREQRERDLNEVEELAEKSGRKRRRRGSDQDSLEGFELDRGFEKPPRVEKDYHRHKRSHHHHRERSRSPHQRRSRTDRSGRREARNLPRHDSDLYSKW